MPQELNYSGRSASPPTLDNHRYFLTPQISTLSLLPLSPHELTSPIPQISAIQLTETFQIHNSRPNFFGGKGGDWGLNPGPRT
jgi:hypothetical protein